MDLGRQHPPASERPPSGDRPSGLGVAAGAHGHAHGARGPAGTSALLASAAARLGLAGTAIAGLWLAVLWAL